MASIMRVGDRTCDAQCYDSEVERANCQCVCLGRNHAATLLGKLSKSDIQRRSKAVAAKAGRQRARKA